MARFVSERGFSMIEAMIGVAIMSTALIFALRTTDQSNSEQRGQQDAETLSTFQQLAAQYFISNRTAMMAAMISTDASDANVQTHCVVKIPTVTATVNPGTTPGSAGTNGTLAWSSTKKTCAMDATLLQAKGQWPNLPIDFQDTAMGGQWRYVAIFRRVMAPGPDSVLGTADDVATDAADMLTLRMDGDGNLGSAVTAADWNKDTERKQRTGAAREALGSTGGTMPIGAVGWCTTNKTTTQVCGNGWTINLTDFLDATQLTTLRNKLPS